MTAGEDGGDISYEIVREAPEAAIVALYASAGWWTESARARAVIPSMIAGSFCFMVAKDRTGRFVGMARVLSDGVSDAYIQDVVVLPELRGKGIGAGLIERLVARCRERGIDWIGLVAEPGTTPFYERLRFKELLGYRPMRFEVPTDGR